MVQQNLPVRLSRSQLRLSRSQLLTLLICAVYLALLAGGLFAAEGRLSGWNPNASVGVFGASFGLNFLYMGVVAFGLVAMMRPYAAQFFGWIVMLVFVGLTAYGAAALIARTDGDLLNMTWANVVLYALTVVLGMTLGLGGPQRSRPMRAVYNP